jgi:hypothetical protein
VLSFGLVSIPVRLYAATIRVAYRKTNQYPPLSVAAVRPLPIRYPRA